MPDVFGELSSLIVAESRVSRAVLWSGRESPAVFGRRDPRDQAVVDEVFRTGRTTVVSGAASNHAGLDETPAATALIGVPIRQTGVVVAVLVAEVPVESGHQLEPWARFWEVVAAVLAQRLGAGGASPRPPHILGNSPGMQVVFETIERVAPLNAAVLIRGQTGTGKHLVARAIHRQSPRSGGPFVRVNCSALSETLLAADLFGCEAGALAEVNGPRTGRLEQADGGTLFVDEVGLLSVSLQSRLLRVIQEGRFERLGSSVGRPVDTRVIAASNRDLEAAVAAGTFRQDLYYRINVLPVFLPPLRQRQDDLLILIDHFVAQTCRKLDKPLVRLSPSAINMMVAYHWPGNVRELENCIERAVLLCEDGMVRGEHLPVTLQAFRAADGKQKCTLTSCVQALERDLITAALRRCDGNVSAASRQLGITSRMTRYKMSKLKIRPTGWTRDTRRVSRSRRRVHH